MELEIIRMCAAAANDPTIGVNAMIDGLPIDAGDQRPPHVHIYTSVDHGWVARREVTEQLLREIHLPALCIFVILPADLDEVQTVSRDGHFPISFAYVESAADTAKGKRDALYTNRAVQRFLSRFVHPSQSAKRLRNGVQIVRSIKNQQPPATDLWKSAIVMASTVVTFLAREINA